MNHLFPDQFQNRHIGPNEHEVFDMLQTVGTKSIDKLIDETVPASIRLKKIPKVGGDALTEMEYLNHISELASQNKVFKSYIGLGYYDTFTPSVIRRNVFENPGWYTQYTPYQAEIAQGRLEALLNYQTMVSDLTGFPVANASLLDEGTAAAEAMIMLYNAGNKNASGNAHKFFVDESTLPHTIEVLKTRSKPLNIELVLGDFKTMELNHDFFGALLQYPSHDGKVNDFKSFIEKAHATGVLVVMANDSLNVEFEHLNHLTETFGIHLNGDSKSKVYNDKYEMAAFFIPQNDPIFTTAKKVYLKEVSSLSLSKTAKPILVHQTEKYTVGASAKVGKGMVVVIGDPWFYNEYLNGRLGYKNGWDNTKAADDFTKWLFKESK